MLPLHAVPESVVHAATAKAEPKNAVQADLGLAVVGIAYERMFERWLAFHVTGHVFGTWFGPTFEQPNFTGLGGGVRATVFPAGDGPRGLYIAPFLRIDRVKADEPGAVAGWGYSTGTFAGWSWLLADHFNVRIGAGLQWMAYENGIANGIRRVSFRTLFPAIDLVVGYAF